MKFSTRELVILAVFGALWGLVEISLGSVFHAVDLPMTGMLLSTIGVMVASIGRLFVPRRGTTIFIGVIAMVLKLFSIGNILIGPMVGIFTEALIAELILDAFPKPSLPAFISACAGAALWTIIQPFVTGLLLFGRNLVVVWLDLLDGGARLFGLPYTAAFWIVAILAIVHLVTGGIGGWLAWRLGLVLKKRLDGVLPKPLNS
jgi:ABC-type thiamin/hydroxymethylpyrimidine transport system permease subunit